MLALLLLAVVAGALLPVQAGVNAQLRVTLGNPVAATLVSFLVGTVGLGLVVLGARIPLQLGPGLGRAPWWHWTGGLLGAVYVALIIVLAPRLGAATLIAAVVAGQMVASLALDHWALVGFPLHPLSPQRVLGVLLVIGGVALVRG
jgi:bacterial/archaeal transporter family-2 protein